MSEQRQTFDFIVVGSGAGGGVLASRLARNNKNLKVLLIEAGGDPRSNVYYQVPGFHALACPFVLQHKVNMIIDEMIVQKANEVRQ